MKKTILLLTALFICSTTMLFSQQLEIKTLGSNGKLHSDVLGARDISQPLDIAIIDVVDDYVVCKRPVNSFKLQPNIFLLTKDLSSAKYPETPAEYADYSAIYQCKIGDYYVVRLVKNAKTYTMAIYDKHLNFVKVLPMGEYAIYSPIYLGKVGDKHFVKLAYTYKKFALATFDEQMNLVKVEPMENFGRLCCDSNYIYLQNIPLKAKRKDQRNGELLKMDKDMNIVLRKPVTDQSSRLQGLQIIDTLGYSILYNRGTFMTIDKETLEQNKLDLRRVQEYGQLDTIFFEAERIIRISSSVNRISISACDYNGNALQNRNLDSNLKQNLEFLEYRNNKVYAMLNKSKDISIVAFDITTGVVDTVSTFQMEKNPGYAWHTGYDVDADIWRYGNNSYNLAITTEKEVHVNNYYYHGYLSYFHLDKDFKPLKMEEEAYPYIVSINCYSYQVLHHNDDYTLMMQYKQIEGEDTYIVTKTEVQYVLWDKFGNKTVVPTDQRARFSSGGKYSSMRRGDPIYTPSIYKIAPDHYYVLAGIPGQPYILLELKVKP